ncbi:fructosamine kinase family protein [Lyngbya confervoides]|uniref:Fructosamine kinase family protein n=1 Tax=Lyngbya confervoides BDU141951 TaxID=1574623 RepID=A0ABD4T6H2_9CYAN|nr:fructosamine kinase family protein [Lyngbya confervoides]MCM1984155.1 fructosamine kinase family protein [Lyngbya confervoides BDU141951]
MWQEISAQLSSVLGQPIQIETWRSVGGGSINQAYWVKADHQEFFIKLNDAAKGAMFEAEALGLQEILQTSTIRVPQPLCWGNAPPHSYIALEWIPLGSGNQQGWYQLGQNLAKLHRVSSARGFGWCRDNTIGETPQKNPWTDRWVDFFRRERLGYQLRLAQKRGANFPGAEALLAALDSLLNHDPQPSLVHGDLWSGNAGFSQEGDPLIFDPAPYYGDREVDLAMTELFGGFPAAFYQGYQAEDPVGEGYAQRRPIYNLYHVLNHFNLFGGSYQAQARQMIQTLVSAL